MDDTTPDSATLSAAWHTPESAIIKPDELAVHFSWGGSEFINCSLKQIAALLAGDVVVLFRDFDDTIYLRLNREAMQK